jgi:hypothetical protein
MILFSSLLFYSSSLILHDILFHGFLGKTVTVLALILSTAGILPKRPEVPGSEITFDESWTVLKEQQKYFLGPIFFKLKKNLGEVSYRSSSS